MQTESLWKRKEVSRLLPLEREVRLPISPMKSSADRLYLPILLLLLLLLLLSLFLPKIDIVPQVIQKLGGLVLEWIVFADGFIGGKVLQKATVLKRWIDKY